MNADLDVIIYKVSVRPSPDVHCAFRKQMFMQMASYPISIVPHMSHNYVSSENCLLVGRVVCPVGWLIRQVVKLDNSFSFSRRRHERTFQ